MSLMMTAAADDADDRYDWSFGQQWGASMMTAADDDADDRSTMGIDSKWQQMMKMEDATD